MHQEAISGETNRVLEKIAQSQIAGDFYLAGGTALALQLGHRMSVDSDWFSSKDFANASIKAIIAQLGNFELTGEDKGTIHGILDGVKVSLFHYPYALLYPLVHFGNINLADERDIACMKIDAISSRGSKKDFIDLYVLLEKYSLGDMIGFFEKKYASLSFNTLHIFKSMVFFEDAEQEPMPFMLKSINWEDVKRKISLETDALVRAA